jgi:hypothetical protein
MLDGHHLVEVHLHAARLPTLKPAWRQWARDFGGTGATNRVYDPDGTVGPGREAHAKRVPCRSARGFGQNGWHERGVFHCAPPAPPWSVQQVLSRVCRAVFSADCSRRLHRPEDIAIDYKQLFEVERGWRDLKSGHRPAAGLPPLEDRIRAHILLCWLALLLARTAEITTGHTWPTIRAELDRLHTITFTGPNRHFPADHRTHQDPTRPAHALKLNPPKKIIELTASL